MLRRSAIPAWLLAGAAVLAGCDLGGPKEANDGPTKAPPVIGRPADDEEAAEALGFPAFATKNTTRAGGADPVADAAAVALAVYPGRSRESRPEAAVLVDVEDWRAAISAAQLAGLPLQAPILFSEDGDLPEATATTLRTLDPTGAAKAGGAQVIRVGETASFDGNARTRDLRGRDHQALAREVDRLHATLTGEASDSVIVAPADAPAYAMPAAGLSAHSGAPVFWTDRDSLPRATRDALAQRKQPRIYVVGPSSVVSQEVLGELADLGAVRRIEGPDPVRNAIAVARFADGRFGWNIVDPGHGLVFASPERPSDAAAAAPLAASGKHAPLLLVDDPDEMPRALEGYLLDIQPGYEEDPVRGFYNHGWLIGDEEAISVDVQSRIDGLLEIRPVTTRPAR